MVIINGLVIFSKVSNVQNFYVGAVGLSGTHLSTERLTNVGTDLNTAKVAVATGKRTFGGTIERT